jgi:hypothetical protein
MTIDIKEIETLCNILEENNKIASKIQKKNFGKTIAKMNKLKNNFVCKGQPIKTFE